LLQDIKHTTVVSSTRKRFTELLPGKSEERMLSDCHTGALKVAGLKWFS